MKRAVIVGLLGICITVAVMLVGVWASIAFEPWNAIAEDAARLRSSAEAHSTILNTYGDPLAMMHRDALKIAFIACPLAAIAGGLFCGAAASRKPFVALSIAIAPVLLALILIAQPVWLLVAALALSGFIGTAAAVGIRRWKFRRR